MRTFDNVKNCLSDQELRAMSLFCDLLRTEAKGNIHAIILFGSRARGEGHEESDVDVLVLFNEESYPLKIKIWDYAHKVFCETDIAISPLVLSLKQFEKLVAHERLIALTIQKEGIRL